MRSRLRASTLPVGAPVLAGSVRYQKNTSIRATSTSSAALCAR